MRKIFFVFALVIFGVLYCVRGSLAATYYVDFDGGNDSNSGTSQTSAWLNLPGTRNAANTAFVNTHSIFAGDTIYIKSGSAHNSADGGRILLDSSYYANGASNNPITIQRKTDWGSGQVIINGSGMSLGTWDGLLTIISRMYVIFDGATDKGILIINSPRIGIHAERSSQAASYITIKNVEVSNSSATGILHGYSNNDVFDNIDVHNGPAEGFWSQYTDNLTIKNSSFYDNGTSGNQDGVFLGDATNFFVQDCVAYGNGGTGLGSGFDTSNNGGHVSGIFERNYSYGNANVGFSMSSSNTGDTVILRNNISYDNPGWANFVAYEQIKAYYYNNTSGSNAAPGFICTDSAVCYYFNNIMDESTYGISAGSGRIGGSDYNIFGSHLSRGAVSYGGTVGNFSYWQGTLGFDMHGDNIDPGWLKTPTLPDDNYFKLGAGSGAINKGTSLSGFSNDYDMVVRPQGNAWDIGAYEYGGTCTPSCSGKVCGDNGCGGSCGNCSLGQSCVNYQCVAQSCTPNWQCTAWSACANSVQTRTCTDANNCGTTSGKPAESQTCAVDSTKFIIGDRIYVAIGPSNVRQTPAGTLLGTQENNSQGTVTQGPTAALLNNGAVVWWYINFDTGTDGWVGEDTLEKADQGTGKKGDLNADNKVDVTDLGIFLSNWGSTSRPASDINQDGRVDITDLGILLSNWG